MSYWCFDRSMVAEAIDAAELPPVVARAVLEFLESQTAAEHKLRIDQKTVPVDSRGCYLGLMR